MEPVLNPFELSKFKRMSLRKRFSTLDLRTTIKILDSKRHIIHQLNPTLDDRFFELLKDIHAEVILICAHPGSPIDVPEEMFDRIGAVGAYLDPGFLTEHKSTIIYESVAPSKQKASQPPRAENIIDNPYLISVESNVVESSDPFLKADLNFVDLTKSFEWGPDPDNSGFCCLQNGCKIADCAILIEGVLRPSTSLEYYSGEGYISYSDGSFYHGNIVQGVREGIGEMVHKGRSYTAIFIDDILKGKVAELSLDDFWDDAVHDAVVEGVDFRYEGEIRRGAFNGKGICKYSDGRVEEGMYCNNSFVGTEAYDPSKGTPIEPSELCTYSGMIYLRNGDTEYRGYWSNGGREGTGVYTEPSMSYHGQWRSNAPSGNGRLRLLGSRERYDGEFANGVFHGQGTYTFSDGFVYSGGYSFDVWHGDGTLTAPDGHVLRCKWVNGRPEGDIEIVSPSYGSSIFPLSGMKVEGRASSDSSVISILNRIGVTIDPEPTPRSETKPVMHITELVQKKKSVSEDKKYTRVAPKNDHSPYTSDRTLDYRYPRWDHQYGFYKY